MQRLALVTTLTTALTLTATSAFACAPMGQELAIFLAVFASPFLALPYSAFNAVIIGAQHRTWFDPERSHLWLWMKATLATWVVTTLGAAVGFGFGFGLIEPHSEELALAVVFSTPLVLGVAHLMWLHARRPGSHVPSTD